MESTLIAVLDMVNEILASAIVIVAASMLLYNLTRNLRNRVARTSGVVLACVTAAYVCDIFASLNPSLGTYMAVLRLQWIGIAFLPAATFHLSDALLDTTGLPSRGRRRRIVRYLYLISAAFLVAAAFTNILIEPLPYGNQASLRGGPLFALYVTFFLVITGVALNNVQRARQRCRTRNTRRRMGYLQIALLTPAVGIFPFSVLLGPGTEFSLLGLALVNLTNFLIILMLLFLSYPLSFFGSRVPDRVVKTELLRFILRGPGTALTALVTIIFTAPVTRIFGVTGQAFVPFAVVSVVLVWQWSVALALPWLEKRLVYGDDDYDQLQKLQSLSERLLTPADLMQLLEAILAASCDYLRVNTAFVASMAEAGPEVAAAVGPARPTGDLLKEEIDRLNLLLGQENGSDEMHIQIWDAYWIVPLYGKRHATFSENQTVIGFMGIQARSTEIDLTPDEWRMLRTFARRAAQTLDDIGLQGEIFAALEGLLPQITMTRAAAAAVEYLPGRKTEPATGDNGPLSDREQFLEQVRAALRHYWGGPGLSSSRLLEMKIVHAALPENDDNPARALRAVLNKAIEKQRPDGERKMMSPEWTIYNILDLRFIQKVKVRDAAIRLALSEADLYRKQRVAIEALADALDDMERGEDNHDPK